MLGLTGPVLYGGVGALVVIIALSGVVWVQHGRLEGKAEMIAGMKIAAEAWEKKVAKKEAKIDELKLTIADQNQQIEDMADLGELAEERQRVIDELMAELARAEDDLRIVSDKYRAMRDQSVEWNVCETYEAVLQSIAAGGVP